MDNNACNSSDAISAGRGQSRESPELFLALEWGQNNVTLVLLFQLDHHQNKDRIVLVSSAHGVSISVPVLLAASIDVSDGKVSNAISVSDARS